MNFVVYGAGAVGSVLGGMLSLQRSDVLLIARKPLVDAVLGDGLRLKSATAEHVAHPRAGSLHHHAGDRIVHRPHGEWS